jgi:transposase
MSAPSLEICVEITRLYFAEHWKVGTIATQLGLHPQVVQRVLGLGAGRTDQAAQPPRLVDPYRDFIAQTLSSYPTLRATRLYDMLQPRGFAGSVRTLRDYVATVRPRPRREVYLRTEPLLGDQAQIDWAYVGQVPIDGTQRALWLFVMVLSHSRALWGEFVIDLTVHSLTRSLLRAARAFGGVTRQWLFDNPKIIVLQRRGETVRFHPVLLELSGALHVQTRLCAVRRPQHKGKVERAIRYLRDRFLAARSIVSVEQGNAALGSFISQIAHARLHPTLAPRTVGDVLQQEQPRLLPLPDPLPPTDLVMPVSVDAQAFIRFDTNRYSVPSAFGHRTLTLVANDQVVRLLDGQTEVARHPRSFARRGLWEDPAHRKELLDQRRAARQLKGRDRLCATAPDFPALLERWATHQGSLAIRVTRAIKLLDLYGEALFARAVSELVQSGLHDPGALAIACDRLRRQAGHPVPLDLTLPDHIVDRDVIPHDLETYDEP